MKFALGFVSGAGSLMLFSVLWSTYQGMYNPEYLKSLHAVFVD